MTQAITPDNYEEKRRELLALNANLVGVVMRDKERQLDELLTALKQEYRDACGGRIPYDIPVLTDTVLRESRLYRFCSRLPKGGDLHVHDVAMLPVHELIPLLRSCPEFCISDDGQGTLTTVPPAEPVPAGCRRFAEALDAGIYTPAALTRLWTTAGAEPGDNIWEYFEGLFDKQAVLSDNPTFAAKYYDYTFRYYCRCHIMHVEIHLMLTGELDDSLTYVKVLRQAYYNVKRDYPAFTVRIIGAGAKADSADIALTKRCFLNTSYVQEMVKDESDPAHIANFVIGFDLVNEEDTSLPLHAFAPMLLKVKQRYPEMRLYIHGGESLEAGNENLIDAYLLGVSRVGHGLNLYRYPDLHARFVKAEICLEVCPVSNQRLGYARDIRNHPAVEYLRSGVALALCSDDAAYMEYQTLTDDFFAAVVGWNVGVADLKQLGINSLFYSGLDNEEKFAALRAYNAQWNEFVDEMLATL